MWRPEKPDVPDGTRGPLSWLRAGASAGARAFLSEQNLAARVAPVKAYARLSSRQFCAAGGLLGLVCVPALGGQSPV